MRTLLVVVVASLAGACVVESLDERVAIVDDLEVAAIDHDWSEVAEDWPDARRERDCEDHYAACMQTKYGKIYDDPGHTRCLRCMERCMREDGCWPKKTYAGKDCNYKHPKLDEPPWREP